MTTEEITLQELSERPDGREFLKLARRSDFLPPASETVFGDFRDAQEFAEWTCPSEKVET